MAHGGPSQPWDIAPVAGEGLCQKHKGGCLLLYCKKCDVCLCVQCTDEGELHHGHQIVSLKGKTTALQTELETLVKSLKIQISGEQSEYRTATTYVKELKDNLKSGSVLRQKQHTDASEKLLQEYMGLVKEAEDHYRRQSTRLDKAHDEDQAQFEKQMNGFILQQEALVCDKIDRLDELQQAALDTQQTASGSSMENLQKEIHKVQNLLRPDKTTVLTHLPISSAVDLSLLSEFGMVLAAAPLSFEEGQNKRPPYGHHRFSTEPKPLAGASGFTGNQPRLEQWLSSADQNNAHRTSKQGRAGTRGGTYGLTAESYMYEPSYRPMKTYSLTFPVHVVKVFAMNQLELQQLTGCVLKFQDDQVFIQSTCPEDATDVLTVQAATVESLAVCVPLSRPEYQFLRSLTTGINDIEKKHGVVFTFAANFNIKVYTGNLDGQPRQSYQRSNVGTAITDLHRVYEELKSDPDYLRKNGSRSEYLTCLTRLDKLKCPYYWTTHGKHLADIDAPTVKNLKHGLPLIGSLFKDLEKMIQKTFNPQLVGQGADAAGLKHTGIKVKKIEVIENPKQLRRYIGARAECIRKLLKSKNQQRFKNIEEAIKGKLAKARHGGPVKTTRHLTSSLKGTLVEDINEVFLLHGTKPDVADSIKFTGFDARLSFNGMYGGGLYFAEETTKADQYPDRGGRTPGDKHMLIVRTFLGYMYVGTTQPARGAPETLLSRAPCRKCPGVNDKCTTHHSFCDSVVHAADPNIFRELVIYDNDHCYPEFLVTYERQ